MFTLSLVAIPLQLALIRRRYVIITSVLVVGLFIYAMYKKAIEQSYSLWEQQLANPELTGKMLIIQFIESIGGILLSIYLLSLLHGEWLKKGFRFFKYVPGIMPFIALFYLESYMFLNIPGVNFHSLALTLAIGFMIAVWGCMIFFRWLLKDYDIMLEMKFFLHIIQIIVALVLSIQLFGLQVPEQTGYLNFLQTGIILGAILIVITIGLIFYNLKIKK